MHRSVSSMMTIVMAVMIFAVILWPSLALAQDAPPQPQLRTFAAPWLGMFIMFLLTATVLFASLVKSKRSHLD